MKDEFLDDICDTFDAVETARRHVFEGLRFRVYGVMESDDLQLDELPICWTHTIDGPAVLPPTDCWVVLFNSNLHEEDVRSCGGEVRIIFVFKASGEVVYDGVYAEE